MRFETGSPEATEEAAARLAARLERGDVVLISGPLGAGKTTWVRGACRALGVTTRVTSPTFAIGHLYAARERPDGPLEVAHLDLYRLASLEEEDLDLLDDYVTRERIAFVEWPGLAGGRFERVAARVELSHVDERRRGVAIW